jgi:hypothetical protein
VSTRSPSRDTERAQFVKVVSTFLPSNGTSRGYCKLAIISPRPDDALRRSILS